MVGRVHGEPQPTTTTHTPNHRLCGSAARVLGTGGRLGGAVARTPVTDCQSVNQSVSLSGRSLQYLCGGYLCRYGLLRVAGRRTPSEDKRLAILQVSCFCRLHAHK